MSGAALVVPEEIVAAMQHASVAKTDEGLQHAFGISYNTWRRINRREPIRASVVTRLISRMTQAGV